MTQSLELITMFDRGVALDPAAPCLERADGSIALSYRDVDELTHRIAVGLRGLGFEPGTRIGVLSPNDPIGFAAVLGVLRLGGIWIPLNAKNPVSDLRDLLDLCACPLVLCHDRLTGVGEDLATDERQVLALGAGRTSDPSLVEWLGPPGERLVRAPRPDGLAALAGTGGTTGRPKAVMLGHRELYWQSLAFLAHMPEPRPPVQVMAAPMTHAAGSITFPLLAAGGRTIVHDGVDGGALLSSVQQQRATRLFLPPTAIYTLLDRPDIGGYDLSSLEYFLYLAAPMSEAKLLQAIEVFGPVMCQTFGQTEAPTICTWFSREEHAAAAAEAELRHRLRSCGRASVVAELAIMGDGDRLLADGERGEIVVRGPLVMRGYLDDPEATAATRRSGWHATGDIGYRDEHGFVYIVDRSKEMIISGGFNVYPAEVERVLLAHRSIRDCAVIGVPDAKWGEAVTAVVELRDGEQADEDALRAFCRSELGPIKAPKRVLFETLPRSATGKVLRRSLRDVHWAGQERRV
jgi:acyl-CoA synthetase (AMP-forming)/AMP-acid ligase II